MQIVLNLQGHRLLAGIRQTLSSGSKEVDEIKLEVDETWKGFGKIGVFCVEKKCQYTVVDEVTQTAKIPAEVLRSEAVITIGIVGFKDEAVMTSTLVAYQVEKGSVVTIEEPEPSIYAEILSRYADLATRFNNIIANAGDLTNNAELIDARVGADGVVYDTLGEAVRTQIDQLSEYVIQKTNEVNEKIETKTQGVIDAAFSETGFINKLNGTITVNAQSICTDFIPCVYAKNVSFYLADVRASNIVAFYDIEKKFISGISDVEGGQVMVEQTVDIPNNAVYVRFAQWIAYELSDDYYAHVNYSIDKLSDFVLDSFISEKNSANHYKYDDSINKPFDFDGHTAVAFGDSITFGVYSPNAPNVTENGYMSLFCKKVGLTLANNSTSGSCIADQSYQYSIYNRIMSYNSNDDFIFVSGGTNDFNTSKELGTFDSNDVGTFYGALKNICKHLKETNPSAEVIFITPIPYTDAYFTKYPALSKYGNALGYTLNDYRNAIYEVATMYGFNVVDGSNLGMPETSGGWGHLMCDDSDGCHPTILGHSLYARNLANKLC